MFTIQEAVKLQGVAKIANYNEPAKKEFARLARKLLRSLNEIMGLNADIRYNRGGIAVSGEATLHGDSIYIQISGAPFEPKILVRSCKGRKDYTGGQNTYFSFDRLTAYGVKGMGAHCAQFISFVESVR